MKFIRFALLLICLLGISSIASAKGYKQTKVYMFGFAASFNDSTVYFTDIQQVNAYLEDNRSHFLVNRDDYAYQMRNYLTGRTSSSHPTCVVLYAETEKEAMKKYVKLQEKYTTKAKMKYLVNSITAGQFRFETVGPDDMIVEEQPVDKAARKSDEDK